MAHAPQSTLAPQASPPPRVVIENVRPAVDGGRFPIKRVVGEPVEVTADVFADGHDELAAVLRWRVADAEAWSERPLEPLGNDVWRGSFEIARLAPHEYAVVAWSDQFRTWRKGLGKKAKAGTAERVDLLVGAELVSAAAGRARGADARRLAAWAEELRAVDATAEGLARGLDEELARLVERYPDRRHALTSEPVLRVDVDRERARFSSWYEFFPRSCGPKGRHGSFRDAEARLAYAAEMGFDVVYLPPIHPIGRSHRKGRNNKPKAAPGDWGSPWAIGAREGGHDAIHPELGTPADFRRFVKKAEALGLEVALDLAFQCAPDHPWVKQHPQWFRQRPDGSVQYAENPPKKYEDIYPIDFETEDWQGLWRALHDVVRHWIGEGVRIFRVDNPHTKAFRFWEWLIAEVRRETPEALFLAEAFTRPKVMHQLAKLGFSQSYTYYAWRNTKWELSQYLTELTRSDVREFFRPNFWPNTPDILTEPLQHGGRPVFMTRVALAATLAASYGIYGPAYELLEARPRSEGSEEYLDSEKYELRHWDVKRKDSLKGFLTRLNRIRRENPALQRNDTLEFHPIDNEQLLAYSKTDPDGSNIVLTVANLDPHYTQSGWLELPLERLGIEPDRPYQMHDLLTGARFLWHGHRNFVQLDPHHVPVHVLRLRRKLRTEHDFDYFL